MSDLHADNRTASRAGCARVTRVQDPDDPGTIVAPADPGPATPPGYRCWPPDPVALRRLCSLVTARVNTSPGRDLWPISRVKRLCRKASVGRAPRVRPVPASAYRGCHGYHPVAATVAPWTASRRQP